MVHDGTRIWVLGALLVGTLLLGQACPGFSQAVGPATVLHVATGPVKHRIQRGETLSLLAKRYRVSIPAILKANPGLSPKRLQLGREILIPGGSATHLPPIPGIEPAGDPVLAPNAGAIELRPEKAPQATPPLVSHDLVDTPPQATATTPTTQSGTSVPTPPASAAPALAKAFGPGEAGAPMVMSTSVATAAPATPASATVRPWGMTGAQWSVVGVIVVLLLALDCFMHGLVANLLAGGVLRLGRRLRIGDVIRLGGTAGQVQSLGLCSSTVRTVDDEHWRVPNIRLLREAWRVLPQSGK